MHTSNSLRAGAAMVEITPASGTHLAGSGAGEHRPAQSVMDPLYARALACESGGRRICMVILDLTIVTGDYTSQIRGEIGARTGLAPEAIMIQATQTHSAPSLGHFMLDPDFPLQTTPQNEYLRGAERNYGDRVAAAAIDVAVEAVHSIQPARIGVGRGVLGDLAFNRRGVRRDGTILMPKPLGREQQPFGIADLSYLEGPIDPELGVCCIQDLDMRPLALLLHYTCHPVNAFGNPQTYRAVSADWPGAWAGAMQQALGDEVVPLVVNGCCGNINPWNPFDPDDRPDHLRMGRELAAMSERIVYDMTFASEVAVDCESRVVDLPYREIPTARQQEVDEILAQSPEPPRVANGDVDPHWFRAASTKSIEYARARESDFAYEIQAFRIGDLGVVGLPGEPFVEGQLALKTNSAAPYLFPAHMTSHYVGYLPTREAYERGGHEANKDITYWAKLAPGCLEEVVDRARVMVGDLFV